MKISRPSTRMVVKIAIVIVFLVAIVLIAYFSPLMSVRKVEVSGNRDTAVEEILETADVPHGHPLFRVNLVEIGQRVATIPRVESVRVSREFPSTISISVTERIAVGYFREGKNAVVIDRTGVPFGKVTGKIRVPELVVDDVRRPSPQRSAVLLVAEGLPVDVLNQVVKISAESSAMVVLTFRDGRIFDLGAPDRLAEKSETIRMVMTRPGRVWNVSNPDLPSHR